jgi:hypothetical protein
MKHYLLNHQPQKGLQAACAQQGQAPTCNARGKGRTSASPKTLTKVILVLLTMFLLPSAAWGQTTITVAGNTPDATTGTITGDGITSGSVSYDESKSTLTLNGATITGSIVKTASEAGNQLTINLVGTNTVNGQILFQSEGRKYSGELTFTGDGSLDIASNDQYGVIDGVSSVNTGEGLYIATDSPNPNCHNGYYTNSTNADDNSVKSLTVSTGVTYPIWVYNSSSSTKYTQLTAAAPTFTTANEDDGSVSFNGTTLTLNSFNCKETNGNYVFYIGESKKELTINLDGTSCIFGNCFHYLTGNNTLTFKTSESTPGSLEFTTSPSFSGEVTFVYSSGLGFYSNKISTDWPRLQIGNTYVRGTATPVEGYSNVSFDDEKKILTLGGVTIGAEGATVTDINVYIKDLTVEISGNNTVYGRFVGSYEENGSRAGTITFKKKSDAETANLTISGLGDAHGPVTNFASSTVEEGLYLSGTDTDNDLVSSLSYHEGEYYDFDNSNIIKEVLITLNEPGTKLWIGEKPVTSDNAGNVFAGDEDLDGKVSYDATNHKLSLNGATIEDEIISNVGTLTIDLTGSNSINSISATGNATALAFTGDGDGTLTLKNSDGIISNFSSVDTGNFNLLSNSTPGIHWNATSNKFMDFANNIATELTLTKATVYPLWVAGAQVTEANKGAITGVAFGDTSENNTITGTVKFTTDDDENELLLDGAWLTVTNIDNAPAIVSGLDNLKIKLKNRNDISYHSSCENLIAKSLKSSATLTFSAFDAEGELWTTIGSDDLLKSPFESFSSVNFADQLFYTPGTGSQYIKTMKAPKFIHDEGVYLSSDDSYTINNTDIISLYYTINYVDESKNTETEPVLYNGELIVITEAATLTATAHYSYNGMESDSDPTIGKYFAIADTTIVFNNDTKGSDLSLDNLKISPETEGEGIEFKFMSTDDTEGKVVSYDEQEKQWSIAGIGSCKVNVRIEHNEASIQVLNPKNNIDSYTEISGNLTVLPDKPTIVKEEKDYLDTDKITITRTSVEGESADNIKIFYTWSDDVKVETYQQYVEGGSVSIYDPDEKIPAQTGKLWAWVGYHEGAGMYYNSDVVSEDFTVKTDISDYTVQGLATSATYTGAAIVPAFSVKASVDAETSLTLNTDYTVSYQSVIIAAGDVGSGPSINYTDVDEMVEVGAYRIVITGTGDNYGGTTYADFAIDKADLDIVTIEAIADQTYTGSEITPEITVKLNGNTLSASDYGFSIGYSNNINVATSTSANAPTVTITATEGSNYFTAGTTKVANFNIVQKSLTDESISVTLSASSFTYNGNIQYPEITVKDGETTLTSEAYGYSYSQDGTAVDGPATAGTYTLTISGEGNYTGEITKEITITPKEIATADITVTLATTSYTFDGTEHKPEVSSVTISDVTDPIEYEDAVYTNNVNAALATATENAPTVTVSLKGNYSGTGVATFTIEQADLSDYVVTGLTTPTAYTGSPITPTFSVKATETAETSLTANTDYSVKYQQAGADVDEMKDAGDYKILITGEGNYKGSLDADFTIDRAQLNLTINLEGWAYGDTPNEPSLEGNLGKGKITWEFKAAGAEAYSAWSTLTTTTDAGTYMVKATVAETDNYEGGSKEAEFVIAQLDISKAVITLDKEELTYNGEEQSVTVEKVMVGDIEVAADYYEVSGNSGTEAGSYTLTVTAKLKNSDGSDFKNNFTSSAEKAWKINHRTIPAEVIAEKFTSEGQTYATFYDASESFLAPQGIVAYIITGVSGNSVTVKAVSYVKAGTPVLLQKTSTSTETEETTDGIFATNILKYAEGNLTANGGQYVLYKNEFVKATGSITSGKCYLDLTGTSFAGTRGFSITGGAEGTTAISDAVADSDHSEWFDLQGRKIEKPSKKGLYIRDGKKIVVK